MKNWKQSTFFGMVAIIAFGFVFVGCDDKPDDSNGKTNPTKFEGTWSYGNERLTFNENVVVYGGYGFDINKGTFTITETSFQMLIAYNWTSGQWKECNTYSVLFQYSNFKEKDSFEVTGVTVNTVNGVLERNDFIGIWEYER